MTNPEGAARAPLGVRARQRIERRAKLVTAARSLLAQGGLEGFSMLDLAKRAGVSPATPYNLFGSKAAVLRDVFAAEVSGFHRAQSARFGDSPVQNILGTCDMLAGEFSRRPAFYRSLSASLSSVEPVGDLFVPLGESLLVPLINALERDGALQAWISGPVIGHHLMQVIQALFFHWTVLDWSPERLSVELRVSIGITFLGLLRTPLQKELATALKPAMSQSENFCRSPP